LALLSIVCTVALSKLLQAEGQPSLRINPLDVDARVAVVSAALSASNLDVGQLAALEAQTRQAIALEPVDARLRSLLGEIELRKNEPEAAQAAFLSAQEISKTEQLSLRRLIAGSIERRQTAEAIRYIDLFLRRWPGNFADVAPIVPPLLQDPAAYTQTLNALQARPPWRFSLIRAFARSDSGLASRLLLDLSTGPAPASEGELNTVLTALLREKQYQAARRLFLFTLPDQSWDRAGLVFNPRFLPDGSSLPFEWIYRNTAAAYLQPSTTEPQNGMTVRFLDKPARDVQLRQTLVLEPGRYRLKLTSSGASLKVPRGLYWQLRCLDGRNELARLDIGEGTYRNQASVVDFEVADCPAQSLDLRSGLVADSWLYRYSGRVTFHEIAIERVNDPD